MFISDAKTPRPSKAPTRRHRGHSCIELPGNYFAPGHDARARAWLDKLEGEASIAARVLLASYDRAGPGTLIQAARDAGLEAS
jgi:hypothetical protein